MTSIKCDCYAGLGLKFAYARGVSGEKRDGNENHVITIPSEKEKSVFEIQQTQLFLLSGAVANDLTSFQEYLGHSQCCGVFKFKQRTYQQTAA